MREKLKKIKYHGMIHTSELIANRDEYTKFNLKQRREIFWSLLNFTIKSCVNIRTIIIDKRYINNRTQLNKEIMLKLDNFIHENKKYLDKFDKITIYYDNGQETLGTIIDMAFINFKDVKHIVNFNHKQKILFQVADMLTIIDKINYKKNNDIRLSSAERFFILEKEINKIIKRLKNRRI